MNIVDLTKITKSFCDLHAGTVFKKEYDDGSQPRYCIKISEFIDEHTKIKVNAIDLDDGSWCRFDMYETVTPYDATLHLEQ